MTLTLKIIIGSTRPGRKGPAVAKWVETLARQHGGFTVELVDLADMELPLLDEPKHPAMKDYQHAHTKRWSEVIEGADAFVFVTPEYDFHAPASLVNALQCLSQEWRYKPAGVVSYGGISGGLRASQVLRGLLNNLNVMAIPQAVPLPLFTEYLGEDGAFNGTEKMAEGATLMFNELMKWAGALQTIRA
ncbi:NADPH-dependent FMN reductase [Pararhodobacter sp. CCB-MM2]|uniref:NADPH-dependent FMN reductase n=1 Tax=Pararhodobacter sp. CCB-MM2 TaxID=1786003 RepID=UPI000832AAE6|nr:NAD(P)H-dependent oxidoreductase [Pararhodobacter sp. CCB-MM2]